MKIIPSIACTTNNVYRGPLFVRHHELPVVFTTIKRGLFIDYFLSRSIRGLEASMKQPYIGEVH